LACSLAARPPAIKTAIGKTTEQAAADQKAIAVRAVADQKITAQNDAATLKTTVLKEDVVKKMQKRRLHCQLFHPPWFQYQKFARRSNDCVAVMLNLFACQQSSRRDSQDYETQSTDTHRAACGRHLLVQKIH